jgi:hypothetical protein
MKPLINLAILFVMPLAIGFSSYDNAPATAAASSDGRYCNARYDFCVDFPKELFTKKITSDNEDGIRLTSYDGKVCVEASGVHNVGNWSITDLYDFTFQDITADYPDEVQYLDYEIGKKQYEATFKYANELHYYKTVLQDNNCYVTLMIAVPQGSQKLLNSLKKQVTLELQGTQQYSSVN